VQVESAGRECVLLKLVLIDGKGNQVISIQ
jgi:hypothetical protein